MEIAFDIAGGLDDAFAQEEAECEFEVMSGRAGGSHGDGDGFDGAVEAWAEGEADFEGLFDGELVVGVMEGFAGDFGHGDVHAAGGNGKIVGHLFGGSGGGHCGGWGRVVEEIGRGLDCIVDAPSQWCQHDNPSERYEGL